MSLHARSDVMSVTVPAESGGCGTPHHRPVNGGAPAKEWVLDCLPCENFLKKDIIASGYKKTRLSNGSRDDLKERWPGLWGASEGSVPQTHGEEVEADAAIARTAKDAATANEQALATIAKAMESSTDLTAQLLAVALGNPVMKFDDKPMVQGELPNWDQRACINCGTMITRAEGQKGMLPHRCPACKASRKAA